MDPVLRVSQLKVSFRTYGGSVQAVRDVSYEVASGETLAVVGESGSGKTVTAQAIMGMISPPGKMTQGEVVFQGRKLNGLSARQWKSVRGKEIAMIPQDPMTSLNPTMRIGQQIMDGLLRHEKLTKLQAAERAAELLRLVGIPDPEKRLRQYPHEFSGGMRQRVVIAIALACNPALLVADEPTTALDVTIQAQILELLQSLQNRLRTSIIMITHDLGVVAEMAHRVVVMYAGLVVESGTVQDIFSQPKHPYTWGLLQSIPKPHTGQKQRLIPIEGAPPDLFDPPKGCPFAARCPYAMEICVEQLPAEEKLSDTHTAQCWLNDSRAAGIRELVAAGRDAHV